MTLINPFEKKLRQVKIGPTLDDSEFAWQCPKCMQLNTELKKDFSDNHLYKCFDCDYQHMIQNVPEDIRHWLQSKDKPKDIDQRPRIVRN